MNTAAFGHFLGRYGQRAEIRRRGDPAGIPVRAFLQPMRERGRTLDTPTPLGNVRNDRLLYLGEPGVPLDQMDGGYLVYLGRRYEVQNAQCVYIGDEVSHWWAVLTPGDGEREEEGQ